MPPQQKNRPGVSNLTHSITTCKEKIEVGSCDVNEVGLENFIRCIVNEIQLHLTEDVEFNLNDRGLLYKWKDVFNIEATYAKCLGIGKRLYKCHAYTHEPTKGLTYFVLEEFNQRSLPFLPDFKFHVLIFCWYDKNTRAVTKVSVSYDQHSFFLHCMGIEGLWRWTIGNVLTPPAKMWARAYMATGWVNPFTFLAQIVLFAWGITKLCSQLS